MQNSNQHAFTLSIDWEDFGQLLCRDHQGIITPPLKNIDRQTDIILQMLNDTGKKATFFILGMLGTYRPDLVRKIYAEGHEIGLHGQHHIDMRKLSYEDAKADLLDSKNLVTDIIGAPVFGYRAPYFSIDQSNLSTLEILTEIGMEYDSSIFPVKMKRYGIEKFPTGDALYRLSNGKEIVELPLTVLEQKGKRIPVAGGGYMRAYPQFYIRSLFKKINEHKKNVMLYMHPYEFDTKWIDCKANYPQGSTYSIIKTTLVNIRWNLFRNSIRSKIRHLLETYNFVTCKNKSDYVKSRSHSPAILGRT
jgi:polysaccharide deacetylase family protein (PEP-CTERM system associated)